MTYAVVSADELDHATKRDAMARHRRGLLGITAADSPAQGLTLLRIIEDCGDLQPGEGDALRKVLEARAKDPAGVSEQAVIDELKKIGA